MNYDLISLFPTTIFTSRLTGDYSKEFEIFKTTPNFIGEGTYSSDNFKILSDHPKLKKEIVDTFNIFKNDVMCYGNIPFELTTSWITKVEKNSESHFHDHKNCVFSGVLYFENMENSGEIQFTDDNLRPSSIMLSEPEQLNVFNCKTWSIPPEKNKILIFPSYLKHKITKHMSNETRYSLAFNFMSCGLFGLWDSTVEITVK